MEDKNNLSHHSLESYINDVTQSEDIVNYYVLLHHPKISTISQKSAKLLKLFSALTYADYKRDPSLPLNPKQLKHLKITTLVNQIEGKSVIPLDTLAKSISATKDQLIDLIVRMNIKGILESNIDEEASTLKVLYSKTTGKPNEKDLEGTSAARIKRILEKNDNLKDKIKEMEKSKKKSSLSALYDD